MYAAAEVKLNVGLGPEYAYPECHSTDVSLWKD